MKVFSNGCTIYGSEEMARNTIIQQLNADRAFFAQQDCCARIGDIQEKIKREKKGVRHIFYFHYWFIWDANKPCICSYSYLEREINA